MTNLHKLYAFYNVCSHIEKDTLKDLLENHLPKEYTSKVIEKLKADDIAVDSAIVRNVKCGRTKDVFVFNAIVEVAKEYKEVSENLQSKLKPAV